MTKAEIESRLAKLNDAYDKVLNAQEYGIEDRRLKRVELDQISREIDKYTRMLNRIDNGISVKRIVPRG